MVAWRNNGKRTMWRSSILLFIFPVAYNAVQKEGGKYRGLLYWTMSSIFDQFRLLWLSELNLYSARAVRKRLLAAKLYFEAVKFFFLSPAERKKRDAFFLLVRAPLHHRTQYICPLLVGAFCSSLSLLPLSKKGCVHFCSCAHLVSSVVLYFFLPILSLFLCLKEKKNNKRIRGFPLWIYFLAAIIEPGGVIVSGACAKQGRMKWCSSF